MKPVEDYPTGTPRKIPSWSWTAYTGEIGFVDAPLGETDWTNEVESPFDLTLDSGYKVLPATARKLLRSAGRFSQSSLIFDRPEHDLMYERSNSQPDDLKCVVVGKRMHTAVSLSVRQDHYIILIVPRPGEDGVYERVGVAIVDGCDVQMDGAGEKVWIV